MGAKRETVTVRELLGRIAALEERVMRLEKGEAPPGDGRAAARPPPPGVPRCPGCGLALKRRAGRCVECGFPIEAERPRRSAASRRTARAR